MIRMAEKYLGGGVPDDTAELYRKFLETKQEPLRLAAALQGFFMADGVSGQERQAYGAYLKKRVKPAAEALIEAEAVEELEYLESLGWFTPKLVDGLIAAAEERGKMASLLWLLHLKNKRYGYADRDFRL